MKKKMYLVKREVIATDIKHAMSPKGKIYSIEEASKEDQALLIPDKKITGFKKK